jgi:hypothetical protein
VWNHFLLVYDAANGGLKCYLNGVLSPTAFASTQALHATATPGWYIGSSSHGGTVLTGLVDECRLHTAARDASWAAANYATQSSPLTFASFGAEESLAGPSPSRYLMGLGQGNGLA